MNSDEVTITIKFKRTIKDKGLNLKGKDNLFVEAEVNAKSDLVSTPVIKHIHDEIGIDVREYGMEGCVILDILEDE